MVRCYEFYVMIKNNPTKCDKSDSVQSRINDYMGFMENKGIQFDKSEMDKARFIQFQKVEGLTEGAVTQPTVANLQEQPTEIQTPATETPIIQPSLPEKSSESCPVYPIPIEQKLRPLIECDRCHMANRETTEYKGETLCPSCLEGAQYRPDKKPVEPSPVTATVIHLDTWEQRKASMQVPVSKMETSVLIKLEQKGVHPEAQREFCLRTTRPDYYFAEQNLAIYLDGEVHRGREDRDEALRELLTKRYGVRVVTILYEGSSEATEDTIVQKIIDALSSTF